MIVLEARSEDFASPASQLPQLRHVPSILTNGLPLSVFCWVRKAIGSTFAFGPSSVR